MNSNREDIEEKLLHDLQTARGRLLSAAKASKAGGEEQVFSRALEDYSQALQTFTQFVIYGRIPDKSK